LHFRVPVFHQLLLGWRKELADLHEVGVVKAALVSVILLLLFVLHHQVLDYHFLHVVGKFCNVYLRTFEFYFHGNVGKVDHIIMTS
jgi:hypothetical protein